MAEKGPSKGQNQNFEKQKIVFFSHVPRITRPKNQFPRSKGLTCSPRTDTPWAPFQGFRILSFNLSSRIGPTPFQGSGFFPSTYHQGSAQNDTLTFFNISIFTSKMDISMRKIVQVSLTLVNVIVTHGIKQKQTNEKCI